MPRVGARHHARGRHVDRARPAYQPFAAGPRRRSDRDSPATKRRLGLDDERSWIVLSESNRFAWPGPDIRPVDSDNGYFGPLPPALFAAVKRRFVELARAQRHRPTARTE